MVIPSCDITSCMIFRPGTFYKQGKQLLDAFYDFFPVLLHERKTIRDTFFISVPFLGTIHVVLE